MDSRSRSEIVVEETPPPQHQFGQKQQKEDGTDKHPAEHRQEQRMQQRVVVCNFTDEPGSSTAPADGFHRNRRHSTTERNTLCENVVEEELHGTVVLGNDGNHYVAIDEDFIDLEEIDIAKINNVLLVDNGNGTQTLMLEDTGGRDRFIADKARTKVAHAFRRTEGGERVFSSYVEMHSNDKFTHKHKLLEAPAAAVEDEVVAQQEVLGYEEEDPEGEYDEFGCKNRRTRVFGRCRCNACGQTFVNMARLERHLAVHQQFGAYLCPLCGKTYKYEYNLFFHWRKTCRDMNDLLSHEERKMIEISALRQLVEEIAQKKATIGPLELGSLPKHILIDQNTNNDVQSSQHLLNAKLNSKNLFGDKVIECALCCLPVFQKHHFYHLAVHRGEHAVDARSVGGAFFCDLCGLMFRTHATLIKHWRSGCATIQANLPDNLELTMNDIDLNKMVFDLLTKLSREEPFGIYGQEHHHSLVDDHSSAVVFIDRQEHAVSTSQQKQLEKRQQSSPKRNHREKLAVSKRLAVGQHRYDQEEAVIEPALPQLDEDWALNEGIIFADDFLNVEEEQDTKMLLINEEGKLITAHEQLLPAAAIAESGMTVNRSAAANGPLRGQDGELRWIQYSQSVQCNECFRSFSSIQRLEKHVAGAHCSFGTHHCLLCGSRFKFEYNLMFHYRQICPYLLELLSNEMRQQMEAVDLKKTVRQIAARTDIQAQTHQQPSTSSSAMQQSANLCMISSDSALIMEHPSLSSAGDSTVSKPELGDSVIRRQMMKKIIQKHAKRAALEQFSADSHLRLPQQLLQPTNRPDLPDGIQCPICSVVFYGHKVLVRHLNAAHPNESVIWEQSLHDFDVETPKQTTNPKRRPERLTRGQKRKFAREENEEQPPSLERAGEGGKTTMEEFEGVELLHQPGYDVQQQQNDDMVDVEGGFTPQYHSQNNYYYAKSARR